MEAKVLRSRLKVRYIENSKFFPRSENTLEGRAISFTLVNLTLNGLEKYIKKKFQSSFALVNGKKYPHRTRLNVVRYSKDFDLTGQSLRQLEPVKRAISQLLKKRGLRINPKKTCIRSQIQEFGFLG